MLKLYIINPDYGEKREDMDQRCGVLRQHVGQDVEISMDCLTKTHVEINGPDDVLRATPEILSMAEQAERQGADAVILYCFSDPAIEECRRRLTIPVIGGAAASCAMAPLYMKRPGVILTDPTRIEEKIQFLYHLRATGDSPCRVDAIDFRGRSIWAHREKALAALIEKGKTMKEQGADGLILGCLSFLGLAGAVSNAVGVPVIDPAVAAVVMGEAAARMRHGRGICM